MKGLLPYTINVGGKLMDLGEPQVMGILNVTPDSFYSASRKNTEQEIADRVQAILAEGGSMIDIGAYSSRPGADDVSAEEEMDRLRGGLKILRNIAPDAVVSVDTFRADVAKMCVEEFGVQIINDISGGELDDRMFDTVAALGVPYILMHMKGDPQTMQNGPHYDDLLAEMLRYFGTKVQQLHELGVKDVILDPGFGFAKTLEHNYELMNRMQDLQVLELPMLVGISRKSMIYRLLGTSPEEALNGTSVLNTLALLKGASILRVHDVKAAVEVVQIVKKMLAC
ncbi:MAG: dihydropteroate synthase [Bacteroidaceae bacterium]|nr:dihydropteroate synthase [Bacteroidaceae bacterium]MBR1902761.1 dihydropteroate synthase [Bacteroidaceae bacterium]